MNRRVAAIINPATRGQSSALIAALDRELPSDVALDIYRTAAAGEAIALARLACETADTIVAVGGDGTVAEVATGIHGRDVTLGIVPAGSTNITAQELAIPSNPEAAAALLFGRHRVAVLDVGRCGDRVFLHMAGAGLDSRFFERTSRALKRRIGWLAYIPAATVALGQPPARYTIQVDDRAITVTSPLVVIANGGSIIAPVFRLHPDVSSEDGWLDVLVFTATELWPTISTIWRFVTGSLGKSPYVVRLRGKCVELESQPELPVQLDGDVVTRTPARFEIEPASIRIIAPEIAAGSAQR